MGVVKNRNGTYVVRKKVPAGHEEAVARVLADGRERVSWLQRSLGTKDLRIANTAAKPIMMEFDALLGRASALVSPIPKRESLSASEIAVMADYHYASLLAEDDELRRSGTGSEQVYQDVATQLADLGIQATTMFKPEPLPAFGMSERELKKHQDTVDYVVPEARAALARGDITFVEEDLNELMEIFRCALDPRSEAYKALGMAVLKRYVQHLEAIGKRNAGEVVETPRIVEPPQDIEAAVRPSGTDTLGAAYEGWKKAKNPTQSTDREFRNAVRRFIEQHGDLRIEDIRRSHVRAYREALQMIPVRRSGPLRTADLPALVDWSSKHPDAPRLQPTSINKMLGGVQAIAVWSHDNGFTSDDRPWADPFARMRLEEPEPDREPWKVGELKLLFGSPVFTESYRPEAGCGEAAYWLPLLALFTGARQGELAPLTADDVQKDERTGIDYIEIKEDRERGARLKTKSSRRIVPVHPELVSLGFLDVVASRRKDGLRAPIFPLLEKGARDGFADNWSKWFGRYLTRIGISDSGPVFHSFRHNFKDALRSNGESEDINDVLTGHAGGGVGRGYGTKDKASRFGMVRLADAVAKVEYPGFSLIHLYSSEHLQ
ncbi:site-specific integrase [Hyphomicrobium sp. DMF-1]|jgi:integrase|uniref:site-specific integrase n=1 Tax=Hyphomicrobium sp. DMF-1 TaxID=3019544 RepID=UPI0022EBBD9F|nr:site-specific integrase [Hyphomicrobium sp. DMF-1]WBT39952.1 site-specific integrase [Hyphomicrobium sp. DMF-1]